MATAEAAAAEAAEAAAAALSEHFELLPSAERATVVCVHGARAAQLLDELRPASVVLYDADLGSVRQIELAQAARPERTIDVYFLLHAESVEEQKYRSSLHAEQQAFQALIRTKARMAVPDEWDGRHAAATAAAADFGAGVAPIGHGNAATRRAGGAAPDKAAARVIVDVREFRSALPNMLHLHGCAVVPVTLEVGDYVLSPDVCVERKSVADLHHSLANGRLYNQAEAMLRYYRRPALLIEFDDGRPFSLQSAGDLGAEIAPHHVSSKLALLLLHFPKLRVVWSRSPAHTVSLFAALKSGQEEPKVEVAAAVGAAHAAGDDNAFNMVPQDVLRTLPGVHAHNYRRLMNAVPNLHALAAASEADLAAAIGAHDAKKLHAFLRREH